MAEDPDLPAAVDALAQAATPAALIAAHQTLRTSVRAARRRSKKQWGPLATAYMDAVTILEAQKAAGVPFDERIKGLEAVLRQFWPQTRVWHYRCETCRDTGLAIEVCRPGARCDGISTRIDSPGGQPGKYQRLCATSPGAEYTHEYGRPCFCASGIRWRDRPKPMPEDFAAAGKSKPMTRVGRR